MTNHQPAAARILLVYPEIPSGTYWGFDGALEMVGKQSILPPLGLITIAAQLPEACELRLVDMNVRPLEEADLAWADAVFVSAMIVQDQSLRAVVSRAKAAGKPVVAGGPHPSTSYATLPEVDHFVIGEAEPMLERFLAEFLGGCAKRAYARPARAEEAQALQDFFGEDADVRQQTERPSLNEQPVPRFDLLDLSAYNSMAVQASRGCPIGCEFCDIWRRFGKKPRTKEAAWLGRELDALDELGWVGDVFVVDDNFIGNRKRAKALLAAMAEWQAAHDYPFEFYTEATLTLADDDELLAGMRRAGFDMVFIGIETPAAESLRETRKHINTVGDMREKVARIQRHGIQVTAGFILGFDSDPETIADQMIDCIQSLGIPSAMVGVLQALPDTDLYERLEAEGRLRQVSNGNNTHDFSVNFRTKRPEAAVLADYKRVLQNIYPDDMEAYFARCAALRDRWQPRGNPERGLQKHELRAFFKLLWALPWQGYRRAAARFLWETWRHKPAFFTNAVSLCIQGHHYRAITRKAFAVAKAEAVLARERRRFAEMVRQKTAVLERYWETEYARVLQARDDLRDNMVARYQQAGAYGKEEYGRLVDLRNDFLERYYRPEYERLVKARQEVLLNARRRLRRLQTDARETVDERYESFRQDLDALLAQLAGTPEAAFATV